MKILSHRGYWTNNTEKNSLEAFRRSFKLGFGTETDIRDHSSALVISHDPPALDALRLDQFLDLYKECSLDLPLAINVKADGLQNELRSMLDSYEVGNYFVFDMSVPDGLGYIKNEFRTFTRQSEFEIQPSFYDDALGVWLDEFHSNWITSEVITHHSENQKLLCIVSPELHGRDHHGRWSDYKKIETFYSGELMLCTDHPQEAREYFDAD